MIRVTFEIDPEDLGPEYWVFDADADPVLSSLFYGKLESDLDLLPWYVHNVDAYETED